MSMVFTFCFDLLIAIFHENQSLITLNNICSMISLNFQVGITFVYSYLLFFTSLKAHPHTRASRCFKHLAAVPPRY